MTQHDYSGLPPAEAIERLRQALEQRRERAERRELVALSVTLGALAGWLLSILAVKVAAGELWQVGLVLVAVAAIVNARVR